MLALEVERLNRVVEILVAEIKVKGRGEEMEELRERVREEFREELRGKVEKVRREGQVEVEGLNRVLAGLRGRLGDCERELQLGSRRVS